MNDNAANVENRGRMQIRFTQRYRMTPIGNLGIQEHSELLASAITGRIALSMKLHP
jgi:hypothetical protein